MDLSTDRFENHFKQEVVAWCFQLSKDFKLRHSEKIQHRYHCHRNVSIGNSSRPASSCPTTTEATTVHYDGNINLTFLFLQLDNKVTHRENGVLNINQQSFYGYKRSCLSFNDIIHLMTDTSALHLLSQLRISLQLGI